MPDLRGAAKFNALTPSRFVMPVASVTSTSYSAANTSGLIIVNSTTAGAGVTVTLATAAGNTGQTVTGKERRATAGSMFAVTVATTSSQTIDGSTSCIVPAVFGAFRTIVGDGSNWQVVDYSGGLPQTAACTTTSSAVSSTETDVAELLHRRRGTPERRGRRDQQWCSTCSPRRRASP